MENTGAPTAGMASSSGQDIPKVISSFLRQYFFVFFFVLYLMFFTDYSVGLCFFQDKKMKVKVVYARGRKQKGNEDGNNTKVSTVAATASRKGSSTSDVAVQKEKACKQKGKAVATKQNEAVEVNVILSYFSFFAYTVVFVATK
jgi:hypothetical protein